MPARGTRAGAWAWRRRRLVMAVFAELNNPVAVGGSVRVDEGGGPLGEVDAGEQRQEVADGAVGFAQNVVADAGEVGEQLGEVAGGPPGGGGRGEARRDRRAHPGRSRAAGGKEAGDRNEERAGGTRSQHRAGPRVSVGPVPPGRVRDAPGPARGSMPPRDSRSRPPKAVDVGVQRHRPSMVGESGGVGSGAAESAMMRLFQRAVRAHRPRTPAAIHCVGDSQRRNQDPISLGAPA